MSFDANRLSRLDSALSGSIERGEMPGMVGLVSHEGSAHVVELGALAFGSTVPMRRDTIFRIASLTKLVTAVAAMILVEDGRLRLDDSVEAWLPELANRRVLRTIGSELDDTVPTSRAITLRDLLTYRMGFGSVMAAPGTYPIQNAIQELRIGGDGPPRLTGVPDMDEWLRRLGSLPLIAPPGERWLYNASGDVLGVLVARVSGVSFGAFLQERIFGPLGMVDTGFFVPEDKRDRLAAIYCRDRASGELTTFDDPVHSAYFSPPPMESGAGGLVSTLDDFYRFCRMMLSRGALDGTRILSRAAVELMTMDHLTQQQRADAPIFFGEHSGWGLGFGVDIARRETYHNPGRYGWTGGFGTIAYIDPREDLIGILLTQRMMESPEPPKVFTDFWTLAYGALA